VEIRMKSIDDAVSLEYTVHGAHLTTVPDVVTHEGTEIEVQVPALEVELTALDRPGKHGRIVLRFVGADLQAVNAIFVGAGTVEGSFRRLTDAAEAPPLPAPTEAQLDGQPPPPRTLQPGEEGYEEVAGEPATV
jgi:hypothetical protein